MSSEAISKRTDASSCSAIRTSFLAILLCGGIAMAADQPCTTRISFKNGQTEIELPGAAVKHHQIFVSVRINGKNEDLRFVFDSGAGRTVLTRASAGRLGLHATEKGSIGGVGTGR